jgi:hypothetical protein
MIQSGHEDKPLLEAPQGSLRAGAGGPRNGAAPDAQPPDPGRRLEGVRPRRARRRDHEGDCAGGRLLLAESLQRLFDHVRAAAEGQQESAARLRAGALAFVEYYRTRADEVTLGLYLWHGVRPRGLSRDLDSELNRRLGDTLALLQTAIGSLGQQKPVTARHEVAALFAFLIGALVVNQTGRLKTLGSTLGGIVELHIEALIARLQASSPSS